MKLYLRNLCIALTIMLGGSVAFAETAKMDRNGERVSMCVTSDAALTPTMCRVDATTKALEVEIVAGVIQGDAATETTLAAAAVDLAAIEVTQDAIVVDLAAIEVLLAEPTTAVAGVITVAAAGTSVQGAANTVRECFFASPATNTGECFLGFETGDNRTDSLALPKGVTPVGPFRIANTDDVWADCITSGDLVTFFCTN